MGSSARGAAARGLVLGLCAAGAAEIIGARPARASVFESLPEIMAQHQMPRAPGDVGQEKPRQVVLNGFPLQVATGRTEQRVKQVLDYYQERYPGGVLKDMVGKPVAVRREGEETGTMMIVDVKERARAMEVMNGQRTLSTAGPLRMVYARRSGLYTDYLLAWSERPMPPGVLQPVTSGDAPGEDLPQVPRPPGGLRAFSFAEPKAGYRLAMYKLAQGPDEALQKAGEALQRAGWAKDETFERSARKRGRLVARFTREGRDVVVTARATRGDDRVTQLSYLARDLS